MFCTGYEAVAKAKWEPGALGPTRNGWRCPWETFSGTEPSSCGQLRVVVCKSVSLIVSNPKHLFIPSRLGSRSLLEPLWGIWTSQARGAPVLDLRRIAERTPRDSLGTIRPPLSLAQPEAQDLVLGPAGTSDMSRWLRERISRLGVPLGTNRWLLRSSSFEEAPLQGVQARGASNLEIWDPNG